MNGVAVGDLVRSTSPNEDESTDGQLVVPVFQTWGEEWGDRKVGHLTRRSIGLVLGLSKSEGRPAGGARILTDRGLLGWVNVWFLERMM